MVFRFLMAGLHMLCSSLGVNRDYLICYEYSDRGQVVTGFLSMNGRPWIATEDLPVIQELIQQKNNTSANIVLTAIQPLGPSKHIRRPNNEEDKDEEFKEEWTDFLQGYLRQDPSEN